MEHKKFKFLSGSVVISVLLIGLIGLSLYDFIKIKQLEKNTQVLASELASTTAALSQNTSALSENITNLSKETSGLSNTIINTQQNVDSVKILVGGVEQTVGYITGTVGTLQKLSQIDQQLLKKYSKVYFMNENYVPAHLTVLPAEYTYSSARQEQFVTEALPHLISLFNDAKAQGVTLFMKSGYRSFAEQKSLKSTYSIIYGAGTANSFSADQGYSEHQLGTTLDFITTGQGGNLSGFDKTPAYAWLQNNAYKYGFILSYPKGNKYYIYEPWHWRYVGVKLATYLHNNNINFYDMDQRDIDNYLINIFE
jgi:LAS superfamily LD-carboxypeptidase LdcB